LFFFIAKKIAFFLQKKHNSKTMFVNISKRKAIRMVKEHGGKYHILPLGMRIDLDVFKAAVKSEWTVLYCLPGMLELDQETAKNLFLYGIQFTASIYQQPPDWVPRKFVQPDFLPEVLKHNGRVLTLFPHLYGRRDLVLTAVRSHGDVLLELDTNFSDDKEIVLAAVQNCGCALSSASYRLKCDEEVVRAALFQDGSALEHASNHLRGDMDIVLFACRKDLDAFAFCYLQHCPVVVCAAVGSGCLAIRAGMDDDFGLHDFLHSVQSSVLRDYCDSFLNAHLGFLLMLLGMRDRGNVLSKLTKHGPHFQLRFKDKIASYLVGGERRRTFFSQLFLEAKCTHLALTSYILPKRRK
jgi:hypothetical protein